MHQFENNSDFARQLDEQDPLKNFRDKFYFPTFHEKTVRYFTGNSLGLLSNRAKKYELPFV